MLLIGAAGRNVGKTELACALIRRLSATRRVVGLKVTTIRECGGRCPRGGDGCGVCSSLGEPFLFSEERDPAGTKDTSRLLRAGAARVLWLRVQSAHLEAGLRAVLAEIPADELVVCESNAVRQVLVPGLFLALRRAGVTEAKPSYAEVVQHADRVVELTPAGFDLDPAEIVVIGQRWCMRPRASAAILAGGESRRMGEDKSLLDLDGQPLIAHIAAQLTCFPEVLLGANDPARYAFLGLPVVPDRQRGRGPLMGILSCVAAAAHDLCFVTACDVPVLDLEFVLGLLQQAEGHDVVMPTLPDGRSEPLLAVYRKTIVPPAEELLREGPQRIIALLDRVRVRRVPLPAGHGYANLNTPEDYRSWLLQRRSAGDGQGPPGRFPTDGSS
jgi:molybdopterin-guanine dinucleotide biosynthesis protein A